MKNELIKDLKNRVKEYITDEKEISLINEAIVYAEKNLKGQKAFNGEDFIFHMLRSTITLTKLHSDYISIVCGLINWIPIKNPKVGIEDIKGKFGEEVVEIIESLSKINKLKLRKDDKHSNDYLRKIMVGLATDVRVIIIKLAERHDNLKYIFTEDTPDRKEKALETERILIPLAHRLGINYIKNELDDLCLKYLKPEIYKEIEEELEVDRSELNNKLEKMKNDLSELLTDNNIKFRIKGRVKSIHSLYDKLSKGKTMNQIYDILALRIITSKVSDCYLIIGLIHSQYKSLPKRFKDYINNPKENMYQSLHTGIIGPDGSIFEVQIRTEEMDEIAEYGIASHWSYKEHSTKVIQNLMEQKLELFRNALDPLDSDSEIEEGFKENFANDMIYVYSPKGDVIEMPSGATPVDFAYRIHSHVGDTMTGAIVNGNMVPIDTELHNDDVVNIKTNNNSKPKKEWLNFVKTSQAKNKIKAYFSKLDREAYIEKGEKLLEREIRKRNWSINETLSKENINKLLKILKLKDYDELKLGVGSLRYTASYIMSLLTEDKHDISDIILEKISFNNGIDKKNYKKDIIVAGYDDILVNIANCCKPVYGDDIVGYITKGHGLSVHKASCPNVKNLDRMIECSWNENRNTEDYITRIRIETESDENNILDIVTKCSQRGVSLENINTSNNYDYELLIKVSDAEKLNLFMVDLKSLPFVRKVERINI